MKPRHRHQPSPHLLGARAIDSAASHAASWCWLQRDFARLHATNSPPLWRQLAVATARTATAWAAGMLGRTLCPRGDPQPPTHRRFHAPHAAMPPLQANHRWWDRRLAAVQPWRHGGTPPCGSECAGTAPLAAPTARHRRQLHRATVLGQPRGRWDRTLAAAGLETPGVFPQRRPSGCVLLVGDALLQLHGGWVAAWVPVLGQAAAPWPVSEACTRALGMSRASK